MGRGTLKQIDDFLALKRIAFVGVSRNPKDFNSALWQEFRQRRVDAVPVNPRAQVLDGQPCFARVQDIAPAVEGALIMTAKKDTEQVVRDCIEAGIKKVWMYGGAAPGAQTKEALALCDANGIEVIAGYCPYMFFKGSPAFHGLHRGWKKLTGSYPKPA